MKAPAQITPQETISSLYGEELSPEESLSAFQNLSGFVKTLMDAAIDNGVNLDDE